MKRFVIVGSPVTSSLSPAMYRALFDYLGVDWTYERLDVPRQGLAGLLKLSRFDGYTVTMPLKEEAFALTDHHDSHALQTGAVNTIVMQKSGSYGANTDVPGFRSALAEAGVASVGRAIIIGSGATARSAAIAIRGMCQRLDVLARNQATANAVPGVDGTLAWESSNPFDGCDLVISTLPSDATHSLVGGNGLLFDVAYRPWPTLLASRWNGPVLSGMELLVHQGVYQAQIFADPIGLDPDEIAPIMRRAAAQEPPLPR